MAYHGAKPGRAAGDGAALGTDVGAVMASFLIRARIEEAREQMLRILESQEFTVSERRLRETRLTLVAKRPSSHLWLTVEAQVELEAQGNTTLASADFRPALWGRISSLVAPTAIAVIASVFGAYPDVFLKACTTVVLSAVAHIILLAVSSGGKTPLTELPTSYLVLTGALVALVPLLSAQSRASREALDELPKAEMGFWRAVKRKFHTRLLALAQFRPLGTLYTACYVTAVMMAGAMLLYAVHPIILFGALPLWVCLWVTIMLPLAGSNQPGLYPRALAAVGNARIVLVNSLVLLLVVFGLGMTVGRQVAQGREAGEGIWGLAELREYLGRGGPLLDDVRSGDERMGQVQEHAAQWAHRIADGFRAGQEHERLIEVLFVAVPAVLLGLALWLLVNVGLRLWGSAGTSLHGGWRDSMVRAEVDWIRLPATVESRTLRSVPFRTGIGLLFVAGSVVNWVSLLVAVDVLAFALTDRVILFPQIVPSLTWAFVPFKAAGLAAGSTGSSFWDTAARACMMAIAAPPMIIWARRAAGGALRLVVRAGSEVWSLVRRSVIPPELRHYVRELSHEQEFLTPRLRPLRRKAVCLILVPDLLGSGATLYISMGALRRLTGQELRAAVAHELGHVRQRPARLRWLRILSILGGHPSWFLLLSVDLRKMEEEADGFALHVGADAQTLVAAILKASNPVGQERPMTAAVLAWVQSRVPEKIRARMLAWMKSAAVIDRFLFSDHLLVSSHPAARDRIAAILASAKVATGDAEAASRAQ